ncbi:hypothetical protein Tco_0404829 [Tanacetum coccineum]
MSKSVERAPTPADSIVRNTAGKGSKQTTDGPPSFMLDEKLRPSRQRSPTSTTVFTRLGERGKNVFTRLDEREKDAFSRLRYKNESRHRHTSARRHAGDGRTTRDPDRRKREARNLVRSYVTCSSKRQREIKREWDTAGQANHKKSTLAEEEYFSESENDEGGHWKSNSKKPKSTTDEEDLSQPWICEETDPLILQIRNFEFPKRIRMPSNVKTYDGTGVPEDHLKFFKTVAKVERLAMSTWCHMFNSTLIGSARLWFDELLPKSIDSYVEL